MTNTSTVNTANGSTAYQFAVELLGYANNGGIKGLAANRNGNGYITADNISGLEAWFAREGGTAGGANNPLNVKTRGLGSHVLPNGISKFDTFEEGVNATAETIGNGYYPDIVRAIGAGNFGTQANGSGLSSDFAKWSGNGYTTLNGTKGSATAVTPGTAPDLGVVVPGSPIPNPLPSISSFLGSLEQSIPRVAKIGLGLLLVLVGVLVILKGQEASAVKGLVP
jgi:hypothetical protein